MNKTRFKAFLCSFVLSLSAILVVDRAFFYTPESSREDVKIPRRNITLFFGSPSLKASAHRIEPVQIAALTTPKLAKENFKLAQADLIFEVDDEVPLQREEPSANLVLPIEENSVPEQPQVKDLSLNDVETSDIPVIYAGEEQKDDSRKTVTEDNVSQKIASALPPPPGDITNKPIVLQATRQIFKIDNLQKYQEKHQADKLEQTAEEIALFMPAEDIELKPDDDIIPLQNSEEEIYLVDDQTPKTNQVASLGGNVALGEAEEQVIESKEDNSWETMAEKYHEDTPWVVARGSKFVKNKQSLKEGYASDAARQKAESLLSVEKTTKEKATKVAVQDNLLIPIPQELLDEDELVPNVSDDGKSAKPHPSKIKKQKKESSLLDSIASVFSKENRERAIKNLKERSASLMKGDNVGDIRPLILPTEIRLSFQPNRAEISGQTLRWIQAFAKKAVDDKDVGLQIRIDGSKSFALQQRRLNLLYNILTANGVEYQKINTVFVDREPNSFIVRTMKIVSDEDKKEEDKDWKKYYQNW